MRYNGGKSRIAKYLAPIVNRDRAGRVMWEPFCGGLSMTVELAKAGPLVASDAHPGLIALYEKLRSEPEWLDGFECSEADYHAAKRLPDSDPAKAFIGFGCAFGGKWFGGYARPSTSNPSYTRTARNAIKRKIAETPGVSFVCGSFFDIAPRAGVLLYCDPPYSGTTGYTAVGRFDSAAFYDRCLAWARSGSIVYISEYTCPVGECVWEREQGAGLGAGVNGSGARVRERLYRLA